MVSFLFVALFFSVIEGDFCLRIELRPSPMLYRTASVSVTFAQILGGIFPNRRATQDTGNSLRALNSVI